MLKLIATLEEDEWTKGYTLHMSLQRPGKQSVSTNRHVSKEEVISDSLLDIVFEATKKSLIAFVRGNE
jgi:hypothetical protein